MSDEFDLIAKHFAPLAGPGAFGLKNDAAVFEGKGEVVVTADAMVAGVHFLPEDPPDLIARKLLRVNLSDVSAMGARAFGYVLTVALPKTLDEDWVAAFAGGLALDQQANGVGLLGGDTVSTPGPLSLSLTALGRVMPGCVLSRSGAQAGDDVYVSGTIGDGALGLMALRGALPDLTEADRASLAGRYRLPEPPLPLGPYLAERRLATAAIDVSDGLVADLAHIAEESGLAAELDAAAVPLSPAARAALDLEPGLLETLLTGGDDYELIFSAPRDRAAAVASAAAKLKVAVARIGRLAKAEGPGGGGRVLGSDGRPLRLSRKGWDHFA